MYIQTICGIAKHLQSIDNTHIYGLSSLQLTESPKKGWMYSMLNKAVITTTH